MCWPKFPFKTTTRVTSGRASCWLAQERDRSIDAAVVHEHDLVGPVERVEHRVQALEQRGSDRFLVVDRDDDRKRRSHRRWAAKTAADRSANAIDVVRRHGGKEGQRHGLAADALRVREVAVAVPQAPVVRRTGAPPDSAPPHRCRARASRG